MQAKYLNCDHKGHHACDRTKPKKLFSNIS